MNIFSGSRRIATVAAALWVTGWFIAAALHETKVHARYDFVVGSSFANFAGFDLYSCPQKTDQRSLEIKTESGHPVRVTLCIDGSSDNTPQGLATESFDPDKYLARKNLETEAELEPNTIKVFFTNGTSHIYKNIHEVINYSKVLERTKKDFPNKEVSKIVGNGLYWVNYEALAKIFGGVPDTDGKQKKTLTQLQQKSNEENKVPQTNPFDFFDESKIHTAFKIREGEQVRLNDKWWESWRSTYGQGLAVMLGGLLALWIFSMSMGWIVRGFLGIPRGMDSRP
jgi:hypothetical protein